jgi:signal transduction histidine kinase
MKNNSESDYRQYIGNALGKVSEEIADQWLSSLQNVVNEDARDIFPTEEYLDHIPGMIDQIGRIIASEESAAPLTNSLIERKSAQLGKLRYKQSATVNQLLREYDLLSYRLEEFIRAETKIFTGSVTPEDSLGLMTLVAKIVRRIQQSTVDSFVENYMAKIESQTEKILSFNRFVSHELKTPLQAAVLNIEMLLEEKSLGGEDTPELLRIHGSIAQAISLLSSIENLVEQTTPLEDSPTRQEIDLSALFYDVKAQLSGSIRDRDITVEIAEQLGDVVADTAKLRLVFTNLLTNAIKYSDPNKASRVVRVMTHPDSSDSHCHLVIEDNGLGISPDLQNEVFNIRVRAHENTAEAADVSGHGIGLYLVKETMDELGGTISLSSSEREWTKVELTFPRQPPVNI